MVHRIGSKGRTYTIGFLACLAMSSPGHAGSTSEVSIGQITTRVDSAFTRVQIIGNTIDLGCLSSGYVLLDQTAMPQYESTFSMVLSAYAAGKKMVFSTLDQCGSFNASTYAIVRIIYLQP